MDPTIELTSVEAAADDPLKIIDVHCFLQDTKKICNCEESFISINVKKVDHFGNIIIVECKRCNQTAHVNPWWVVNKYTGTTDDKDVADVNGVNNVNDVEDVEYVEAVKGVNDVNDVEDVEYVEAVKGVNDINDVKEEIVRFIQCHNPTKTLSCQKDCKGIHRFVPSQQDRFGIVSAVGCLSCHEEMSLEMNTESSNTLTVVENAEDLEPGDEIKFRRWYGLSHHAICLGKVKAKEKSGCCNGCCGKRFVISDDYIDVIGHTIDKEKKDARITRSEEWLQGGIDVFRVEYESCYPLKWTQVIAKRAQEFAKVCKDQPEMQDSKSQGVKYNPLMENCEHFARRCKTGQSESRQVKTSLYDCGKHIAMFALRVAILAAWWIAEAAIEDEEETDEILKKKLANMELIAATFLFFLFLTLKVVLSSIDECRQIKRRQESTAYEQNTKQKTKKQTIGRYGEFCSACCRIILCCPKQCYGFRYFCRMLCFLLPYRLCNEFYHTVRCAGCSCERKQCCEDPIMKFFCRQYVVIIIRVAVSEIIVVGIPIVFFAIFQQYCELSAFTGNSWILAGYGFLFTFLLVFVLSCAHFCITNTLSRIFGWCCLRCCSCCYCCCSPRKVDATKLHSIETARKTCVYNRF